MNMVDVNEGIAVGASPEAVVIRTVEACNEDGEAYPFPVHLVLPPEVAVKFANAILHAAANLPDEPDDLYLEDGSNNPAYAE